MMRLTLIAFLFGFCIARADPRDEFNVATHVHTGEQDRGLTFKIGMVGDNSQLM